MSPLDIPAVSIQMGQVSAIAIIAATGIAFLVAVGFLIAGIFSQNKYDNNSLPSMAELYPETESSMIEIDDEEVASAFNFEDDEFDSAPIGNAAADEILKDMRTVEAAPPKSKKFGLFGGK